MATPKTVWGIDIGQVALKAVKLRNVEGELQVEAFDIIEHSKILSEPDADRRQLIRSALEQFLARNNVSDSTVAVAVPGQSSFTRFVKLPPVDAKKIPDIVRYEAEQQIPFPIDDVVWRWQTFVDPDSPDMEVGIFAMKHIDVNDMLDRFTDVGLNVDLVQMAPLALYNFLMHDEHGSTEGATLLADVGADKTDLIVADGPRMWTRTIQIGGNNFTEALVKAFKLSFAKAELLKRTATTSKYAKRVFQAMRPVFADLVQEIQRSIGFYTATHRDTRFKRIVGLGNGFRLPGLQKFLEQNLNISVVPVDSYNKVAPSQSVSAPQFNENVLSLAVACGLAMQGLGIGVIKTNLLPEEIATKRIWAHKRPWFAATAAALLLALAMPWYDNSRILGVLNKESNTAKLYECEAKVRAQQDNQAKYAKMQTEIDNKRLVVKRYKDLFNYRVFWPALQGMVWQSLSQNPVASDRHFIQAYVTAPPVDDKILQLKMDAVKTKSPRSTREYILIEQVDVVYLADAGSEKVNQAPPGAAGPGNTDPKKQADRRHGFKITVKARTPMPLNTVSDKLYQNVGPFSRKYAADSKLFEVKDFDVVKGSISKLSNLAGGSAAPAAPAAPPGMPGEIGGTATTGPAAPKFPDPWMPDEDMVNDTVFTIGWIVIVTEPDNTKKSAK